MAAGAHGSVAGGWSRKPMRGGGRPAEGPTDLVIDCATCAVRSPATCADCVVSVLLGPPSEAIGAIGADGEGPDLVEAVPVPWTAVEALPGDPADPALPGETTVLPGETAVLPGETTVLPTTVTTRPDASGEGPVVLDEVERAALAALADGGLVPPLRLVPGDAPSTDRDGSTGRGPRRPPISPRHPAGRARRG
ncbi:MAG: hypothetical protein R2737_04525 [Candidatus Nanopelagicales bacterium]